jgi:uncharacterized surface protein with fasciclin (FAS1) repeats
MRKLFAALGITAVLAIVAVDSISYADPEPATYQAAATMDIVDIAASDGRFTTLVAAVQAAGLVDTLKSDGPFTVFAPTDEAFAQLPAGTVEALLADIPSLTNVLLYHVVPGAVSSSDVVQLSAANTASGTPVSISASNGMVMVNGSHVIITDIQAANGVIHVIDAVLIPPMS